MPVSENLLFLQFLEKAHFTLSKHPEVTLAFIMPIMLRWLSTGTLVITAASLNSSAKGFDARGRKQGQNKHDQNHISRIIHGKQMEVTLKLGFTLL